MKVTFMPANTLSEDRRKSAHQRFLLTQAAKMAAKLALALEIMCRKCPKVL